MIDTLHVPSLQDERPRTCSQSRLDYSVGVRAELGGSSGGRVRQTSVSERFGRPLDGRRIAAVLESQCGSRARQMNSFAAQGRSGRQAHLDCAMSPGASMKCHVSNPLRMERSDRISLAAMFPARCRSHRAVLGRKSSGPKSVLASPIQTRSPFQTIGAGNPARSSPAVGASGSHPSNSACSSTNEPAGMAWAPFCDVGSETRSTTKTMTIASNASLPTKAQRTRATELTLSPVGSRSKTISVLTSIDDHPPANNYRLVFPYCTNAQG
jgi:hypothetical protein